MKSLLRRALPYLLFCLAAIGVGTGVSQTLVSLPTVQTSSTLYAQGSSVVLNTLTGQQTCTITITGTFGGTINFLATTNFGLPFSALSMTPIGGGTPVTSTNVAGQWTTTNCGTYVAVQAYMASWQYGSPTAQIIGVGSSSGFITNVTATAPIVATTSSSAATVSCPTCVVGLTAGTNIIVGSGTTPSVAETNAPSWTGPVTIETKVLQAGSGAPAGSCGIGDTYFRTDAIPTIYTCTASNTWNSVIPTTAGTFYGWTGSAWSPAPTPTATSANANCTVAGLTITCTTPTPLPSPSPTSTGFIALTAGWPNFAYGPGAISAYSVLGNNSAAAATPVPIASGALGQMVYCAPVVNTYAGTSTDTSGTYTTPTCNGNRANWLQIRMVGGGGGGGGAGTTTGTTNQASGDASTFGSSFLTANGGTAGGGASTGLAASGAGGTASGGNLQASTGESGAQGTYGANSVGLGGRGGDSFVIMGGNTGTVIANAGNGANASGCGAGGSGGGAASATTYSASGGGAGGQLEHLLTSPAATYSYTAGKYGAGGTNAVGSPTTGGNGSPGCIIVVAHWQ